MVQSQTSIDNTTNKLCTKSNVDQSLPWVNTTIAGDPIILILLSNFIIEYF